MAALTATASERNDTISSSIESSTTPPMSSGSRLAMLSVLSIDVAVTPPTWTVTPVPSVACGKYVVAQRGDQVLGRRVLRPGRSGRR